MQRRNPAPMALAVLTVLLASAHLVGAAPSAQRIYWTNGKSIKYVNLTPAPPPPTLIFTDTAADSLRALAVNTRAYADNRVFYGADNGSFSGSVGYTGLEGQNRTVVTSRHTVSVAVWGYDGSNPPEGPRLYYTTFNIGPSTQLFYVDDVKSKVFPGIVNPHTVAVHQPGFPDGRGHLYYGQNAIYRSDLDGNGQSLVLDQAPFYVQKIAFTNNKVVWLRTDGAAVPSTSQIWKADLDGTNDELVYQSPGLERLNDIAIDNLDTDGPQIYFSRFTKPGPPNGGIDRIDINGGNRTEVVSEAGIYKIALQFPRGQLGLRPRQGAGWALDKVAAGGPVIQIEVEPPFSHESSARDARLKVGFRLPETVDASTLTLNALDRRGNPLTVDHLPVEFEQVCDALKPECDFIDRTQFLIEEPTLGGCPSPGSCPLVRPATECEPGVVHPAPPGQRWITYRSRELPPIADEHKSFRLRLTAATDIDFTCAPLAIWMSDDQDDQDPPGIRDVIDAFAAPSPPRSACSSR